METLRGNKILSPLRRLVIYCALFALITPLFHTHALAVRKMVSAASAHAPHLSQGSEIVRQQVVAVTKEVDSFDDCLLCQWLTQNHTAVIPEAFLFLFVTTEALLLLRVRFAALCARPTPRRGLRAPPFALLTA